MKKSLTLLAGASMLFLGVPSVVLAQGGAASGPFADVPADHWAYQSVDNLQKAGIVIGYPDGTYGGRRAMTRYEFAVAIARLLPLINGNSNYATKDDLAALRQDLENKLAANQSAIDDLRRLVNEFQPELQRLGQDVAAINQRLDALEARVAAVEAEQRRVKITGDVNLIGRADAVTKDGTTDFRDKNGVTTGRSKHLLQAADVYHNVALNIRGKLSDTATANVRLDFGNYLSAVGNTAAQGYPAGGLLTSGGVHPGQLTATDQTTTVWEAYLDAPVSLGPLGGAELVAGRFGNQWTKYTLKQVDADVYTYLYETDSGNIPTDGAKVSLKLGPARVQAFAGKNSAIPFAQPWGGNQYTNVATRPFGVTANNHAASLTQGAGLRATFGAPEGSVLGLTYEEFGLDTPSGILPTDPNRLATPPGVQPNYNRLTVWGADFNGALPILKKTGLVLDASYTQSAEGFNNSINNVGNGWRYASNDDELGVVFGALSIKGGYQYIGPEFAAPGYWAKYGSWTNPTNIEGGVISAKYAFSPKLTLNADYEGMKAAYGTTTQGARINSPLQQGDRLNRYQVGLGYGLTSNYNVDLGYEAVQYDLKANFAGGTPALTGAGKPEETYLTLGVGHTFNTNASFKLLYQIVDYTDKGTGFDPAGDQRGGVAVGQFSLKF